jgi:hypothetical protein
VPFAAATPVGPAAVEVPAEDPAPVPPIGIIIGPAAPPFFWPAPRSSWGLTSAS